MLGYGPFCHTAMLGYGPLWHIAVAGHTSLWCMAMPGYSRLWHIVTRCGYGPSRHVSRCSAMASRAHTPKLGYIQVYFAVLGYGRSCRIAVVGYRRLRRVYVGMPPFSTSRY